MSSVTNFLIERLENAGVKHVFGIPGDYILDFYATLWDNENIKVINATDENHAGFAADAYARVNGVGCVCVTYNVGASKVINATQCAYAERSPLIVISGSPGMKERAEGLLLHHMVGSFNSQKEMFSKITCASVVLDNPIRAGYEIDKAFREMERCKQPIYIELPRDIAKKSLSYDVYKLGTPKAPESDPENLEEALEEVVAWVEQATRPAILAGVEVSRYGLGERLIKFAEKAKIPVATTLLSKSVINEEHELFAGIYSGTSSCEMTRNIVEKSDCLLMFGVMLTDMALSFRPSKFEKRQVVLCTIDTLKVKNHIYTDVEFIDFCETLFKMDIPREPHVKIPPREKTTFSPVDAPITTGRMFQKIDSILTEDMAIIADVGDSLFGASDLRVHHRNHFLSPAFYTSMGAAIPGALGVQIAMSDVRPIVIVGDGAFQMSMTEISTIKEHGMNPIIFILNNNGYTTERFLKEGDFNNIRRWDYHEVVKVFGGKSAMVTTEHELEDAVDLALDSKEVFIINVCVGEKDISPALKRMTGALVEKV